jgi:alpha-1,6-mannosyltransferase
MRSVAIVAYLAGIVTLGYLTGQSDWWIILSAYLVSFLAYIYLLQNARDCGYRWGLGLAVAARLLLIFSVPGLSDDLYRFLWDGLLITEDVNPYAFTPLSVVEQFEFPWTEAIADQLNSPDYYSIYPPICQVFFYLAPSLFGSGILPTAILLHLVILIADIGAIHIGARILPLAGRQMHNIWIYAWNPLVIVELQGNLHFEGLMILFLALTLYFFLKKPLFLSSVFLSLAAATKIVPLILLPVMSFRMSWRTMLAFLVVTLSTWSLLMFPVWSEMDQFTQSIDLYFRRFEFNASFYYLGRWIGYQIEGYNTIARLGPVLSMAGFLVIMALALLWKYREKTAVFEVALWAVTVYLLTATTVHPWYVTTLLFLCVFTRYRFAVLWSFLVIMSYRAYATDPVTENLALIAVEYIAVLGWMFAEIWKPHWLTSAQLKINKAIRSRHG